MKDFAIFVNSSDGFEDCWEPFFKLIDIHAPELKEIKFYLNTEEKSFEYLGFKITSTQVAKHYSHRLTWSECLRLGVQKIEEPFLLYLQEDYFVNKNINLELILESVQLMKKRNDIGGINLNQFGPMFKQQTSDTSKFIEIKKPVKYYLSTQAALWEKTHLLSLVRDWENGWMFEKFGSFRAMRSPKKLFSLNKMVMTHQPAFDYVYTGVMKGKWNYDCKPLFHEHKINIDFNKRGFYEEGGNLKSKAEVIKKLFENPLNAFKSFLSIIIN